jgi:hypothetical protein
MEEVRAGSWRVFLQASMLSWVLLRIDGLVDAF